jgi:hypothetical protein
MIDGPCYASLVGQVVLARGRSTLGPVCDHASRLLNEVIL